MIIFHSPIKNRIKHFIPPILTNNIIYFRNYFSFLKYKNLIIKNIKLKNIHQGERCFILGSGPSIINEDLIPLQNEIVFALNNFYVHPDFSKIMSGNKGNYYITAPIHPPQTEKEWKDWLCDMDKNILNNTTMIFGLNQVMIKVVNVGLQPVFQAGLRSVCALVVVFIYALVRRKHLSVTDGSLKPGIITGILFATEFIFLFTIKYRTIFSA